MSAVPTPTIIWFCASAAVGATTTSPSVAAHAARAPLRRLQNLGEGLAVQLACFRCECLDRLSRLVRALTPHLGVDGSRLHRNDVDAPGPQLLAQHVGHGLDRELGCLVGTEERVGHPP